MTDQDRLFTAASEQAKAIAEGRLSPLDVMEATLQRIEAVNPVLNCFCFVYGDEALDAARQAEAAVARGDALGPLHGVPIAIKDLTPTLGQRTTLGSKVYENNVADHDAVIVERLKAAGAIVVGKTTTPEFAHAGFTESPLWGITRNPWDPTRSPGGSSGGSGAAVASGCVPLAEGTDMGGSVRSPAAECGIVGLKPSLGRIPMDILPSQFDNLSHFGPLARTVEDAALFLQVTQGPDDRDISSLPDTVDLSLPLERDLKGLRLALSPDLGFCAIHPEIAANTQAAAEALAAAGAEVEEVKLDWRVEIDEAWEALWGVFMAAYFGQHLEAWREQMDPEVVDLIEAGRAMRATDYKRIEILRSEQWRLLAEVFKTYDALLAPTMARPPVPVELKGKEVYGFDDQGRFQGRHMTEPFNMVGQCPVLAVPSGFTGAGLPTSLSIVGRRFDDPMVLRIGAALEAQRPWSDKRPPI